MENGRIERDEVGLDESLMMGKESLENAAPASNGEHLRAAVEALPVRRTKDGKPYGMKIEGSKGRITAKQRLFASLIVQGLAPTIKIVQTQNY